LNFKDHLQYTVVLPIRVSEGLSVLSKCIVIILDGLGDRSYRELGYMTPLQAAATPNLDRLAELGVNGLFHADRLGMAFSSQDAHFSLFGYDWQSMPRRGVLEAIGAGVELSSGDVAVLGRIVTATEENGTLMIKERLPVATREEIATLMAAVASFEHDGIRFSFKPVTGVEGILVISGDVSPLVTDSDPMGKGLVAAEVKPLAFASDQAGAQRTAKALKRYLTWTYEKLSAHSVNRERLVRGEEPVNALITHLADQPRPVAPFRQRWGLKAISIASKLIQWGVSGALGMDTLRVKSREDPAQELAERIGIAAEKLSEYDFIHVHTIAPDAAAHTKNPMTKKQVIEALDRGLGESIDLVLNRPDVLLVVTSDHSTPSSGPLIHSGEAVPMTMHGDGVRVDGVKRFNEIDCARGALGLVRGREFMLLVLNHLDRCKLSHTSASVEEQPYWPGQYEPFRLK
jgi:2,3-bisphosphoglycerate-independent phosphoglycerate mutase